ncbi:Methylase of chemotaxis methyl-accepting proteins [Saccharicrinis carchari]|uniref:Methylase of chemotaxis methyl-accepting proteins n=1 Tax=Saccharicrinis carchari TaxID=1168039 RepID=A0A521CEQ5_SACCC|nr:CheR family methyltransferase [Saccharicrinis carchari]SMO57908.1 Methylase of chemotaxis methyl-accepting proteins [Saccharicrinis carchari]
MSISPSIKDIREITAALSNRLNVDYSNYAFSFLRRRFAFVYSTLNIKKTDVFIQQIKSGEVIDDFCYTFPVNDSEMFRGPSFWRTLRVKLLPAMSDNLSFWFPDLVSAHELFSLLVILEEEKLIPKAKIFCNVSSIQRINEIKSGKIKSKKIEIDKKNFRRLELDSNFEDYFTDKDGFLGIDMRLLKNVEFLHGNYFNQIPAANISIAFFRNRMIYYNGTRQCAAEKYLHQCLGKGAYLVLGIKEKISKVNERCFSLYDKEEQIYRVM